MPIIILVLGLIIVGGIIIFVTRDTYIPKEYGNRIFILIVVLFGIILILTGTSLISAGSPAKLYQLKKGRAYQVVAIYEKYIVVKSLYKKDPMFINIGGNISQDFVIGGVYIKTSNKKLEKIERMVD